MAGCLLLACATATPPGPLLEEPPAAAATPAPAPSPPPPACRAFARPGVLRRSALTAALNASLGVWLSGVQVDASVQKGRFRGWVVRSLHPGDPCYRDVDVRTGDVVVRVNGK